MSEPVAESKSTLYGWIIAKPEEKAELEALGVEVGPYNVPACAFEECKVSLEAFSQLDPYWGHFFWHLETRR